MNNTSDNNRTTPNGPDIYQNYGNFPMNGQQSQPSQVAAQAVVSEQNVKSGKGFAITGAVLLTLGVVMFWFPVLGVILCLLSLIFFCIARKRKNTRRGLCTAGFIVSIVFLSISILTSLLILPSIRTVDSGVKECAIKKVCLSFDITASDTNNVSVEKMDENTYHVSGTLNGERINYADEKTEVYLVDIDCKVSIKDHEEKVVEDNSTISKDAIKTENLPTAISKIDTKTALKQAEEAFHRTVKLKNEQSYVLNDYRVTASYCDDGDISVIVLLDYSAQNGFGGMTRSIYKIEMVYHDGEYRYLSGCEIE